MSPMLLSLIAAVAAVPLPPSQRGDRWLQVCCKDDDINSNGGISFREFTSFALSLMNLSRSDLEKIFLNGDVDRNSELDDEECIPMRMLLKSTLKEKAEILLGKYDVDGDTNLTLQEVSLLAKKEFGVMPNDTERIFLLSDKDNDSLISASEEISDLMVNLRMQAIADAGRTLSAFDEDHDGQVSYEEIKHEMMKEADGFTLKQLFKSIDFNKDYHLAVMEYLALLNELRMRKDKPFQSTPKTIKMATSKITSKSVLAHGKKSVSETEIGQKTTEADASSGMQTISPTWPTAVAAAHFKIRDKRNVDQEMTRVAPTRVLHEHSLDDNSVVERMTMDTNSVEQKQVNGFVKVLKKFERGFKKRSKREQQKNDDNSPGHNVSPKILEKQWKLLSERMPNNLSGGGRTPSIEDSVTVPYDSNDFQ